MEISQNYKYAGDITFGDLKSHGSDQSLNFLSTQKNKWGVKIDKLFY